MRLINSLLILLVAASVTAAAAVVYQEFLPHDEEVPRYRVGDAFAEELSIDFRAAPATYLVFSRSGCGACEESVGFHRSLIAKGGPNARVFVVGRVTDQALGEEMGGDIREHLIWISRPSERISSVPLILKIDQTKRVVAAWQGRLYPDGESAVLRDIASPSK